MSRGRGAWRVALVTGGGTGIGRGIALALAQRGMAVALVGRRLEPLTATAADLQARGGQAIALAADLTDARARARVVEQVHAQLGPIDTLVNNAALLNGGAFTAQSTATVTATVLTNLVAPIDLTRQLLPDLVTQQGRVVLIGSTTSFVPLPYLALYGATKAALHHFGAALRHEITPLGVHLLMAYPPATATALTAAMAARTAAIRGRKPALAAPEQIGAAIVHALATGQRECVWWSGEQLLRLFYRLAPRLTERLLFAQRHLLRRTLGDATTAAGANDHE